MSLPKSWLELGSSASLSRAGIRHVGVEQINAHGARDFFGIPGRAQLGFFGLLFEAVNAAVFVDVDHSETRRFLEIDLNGGESDVGSGVAVLLHHLAVIHFVDVVAGKNQDVLGLLGADGINVLIDRVGCALIPLIADALHGRKNFDELADFAAENVPAFADVAVQRQRFVLRKNVNAAQVGVEAIGESDVNDAVHAAEGDGRLGAIAG